MTDPARIAAHLRHLTAPLVDTATRVLAERLALTQPPLARTVLGAACALERLDGRALATHLGKERAAAAAGRPRGEDSGRGNVVGTSAVESAALEVHRIKLAGLDVAEAIDRLFPNPAWPPLRSGLRQRLPTATERLEEVAHHAFATLAPEKSWTELHDVTEGLEIAVNYVRYCWRNAERVRAWGISTDTSEPPPLAELARCSGRMNPTCGNYVGAHGHRHPETGASHHPDLCDDCYRLVCPVCWSKPRRTPGARECDGCNSRRRREAA